MNESGHCDCERGFILSSGVTNSVQQCIPCDSNFESTAYLNQRDQCACLEGFQLAHNASFCIQCDAMENKTLSDDDECVCERLDFLMGEKTGDCILCTGEGRFLEITTDFDGKIMEQCGCGDGFQSGFEIIQKKCGLQYIQFNAVIYSHYFFSFLIILNMILAQSDHI